MIFQLIGKVKVIVCLYNDIDKDLEFQSLHSGHTLPYTLSASGLRPKLFLGQGYLFGPFECLTIYIITRLSIKGHKASHSSPF